MLDQNYLKLPMINVTKKLYYLIIFIILVGCSFDSKTGIWSGNDKEKRRLSKIQTEAESKEIVRAYSSEKIYSEEINSATNIKLTQPKKNSDWKMPGYNLQNFMGNIYLTSANKIFLKKKIGKNKFSISKIMTSPIISGGNIYLTDDTGTIFSISSYGQLNWKKNIYKKIYKKIYKNLSISIYKDKIFVADNIGFIFALNALSGKLLWIKNHGIPIKSKIKIFNDNIFLIDQENKIFSMDSKTGDRNWNLRAISSFIKSQNLLSVAISKKGELVLITSSGDLFKLYNDTGQIYWTLNLGSSMIAHDKDFFKSSDIVIHKDSIIFSAASSLFSYNLTHGFLNWEQDIGSTTTPIIDGDYIFTITNNGYFVNLEKKTGKIIWSTNILKNLKKKKRKTQVTGFILGSGKVYATTLNGYLITCSANTGNVESYKRISDSITAPPIIVNESLYVFTENSKVLGFN